MTLLIGLQRTEPGRSRPKGFLAALFLVLVWALAAQAQDLKTVAIANNYKKIGYSVSLGDRGAGKVEVRLLGPGTLLGTLTAPGTSYPLPADKGAELTLVPDPSTKAFSRDIKLTEAGQDPGWAWFRVTQAGKDKPVTVQRAGAASVKLAYGVETVVKPTITLNEPTAKEKATPPLSSLALVNESPSNLFFCLNDASEVMTIVQFRPPNPNPNDTTSGTLSAKGGARQISIPVREARPEYMFNVLIADGPDFDDASKLAHVERYKVSISNSHPFRVEALPFTKPRNFTAIKLVLDDSDPEFLKIKAVAK